MNHLGSPVIREHHLFFGLLFLLTGQSLLLVLLTFLSSLTSSLGLRTSAVHHFLEDSLTLLLCLRFVNLEGNYYMSV